MQCGKSHSYGVLSIQPKGQIRLGPVDASAQAQRHWSRDHRCRPTALIAPERRACGDLVR